MEEGLGIRKNREIRAEQRLGIKDRILMEQRIVVLEDRDIERIVGDVVKRLNPEEPALLQDDPMREMVRGIVVRFGGVVPRLMERVNWLMMEEAVRLTGTQLEAGKLLGISPRVFSYRKIHASRRKYLKKGEIADGMEKKSIGTKYRSIVSDPVVTTTS